MANQNTIAPHVWLSRVDRLNEPDQIVFDLDPSGDNFDAVRRAARYVREMLEDRGLTAHPMKTGSSGVHARAPLRHRHTFEEVRAYARAVAVELGERRLNELTTEHRKKKRKGRIYLDVLRMAYGQTTVPPYAVRARKGAPIARPIGWDELGRVGPYSYTIENIFRRPGQRDDLWKGMFEHAGRLQLGGE